MLKKRLHFRVVNLGGCHEIAEVLVFAALKKVRELFVHEAAAGITALTICERLERLSLACRVHVSDGNHLRILANLVKLHLWSTKVRNAEIVGFAFFCVLVELIVDDGVRVTDVFPLDFLQPISWLSLIETEVDARGVKVLLYCQRLEILALGGTCVFYSLKRWRHDAIGQYLESFAWLLYPRA
ncbi:hypothetical protein MNV84_02833 [Leishmania braziliensis]|nr:hypothetical protein MNV84_02833 [Leishmania braziliensis]